MSYAFQKAFRECKGKLMKQFFKCVKKVLIKFITTDYSNTVGNEANHAKLVELEFLHMGINGYNNNGENVYDANSLISRSNMCPPGETMPRDNGIYLFSIILNPRNGGCSTYHHFMVFILGDQCIIYDTWLGGPQGNRCNWTRVLTREDFEYIFETMNSPQTSVDIKEEIILKIFAGPYLRGYGYKGGYKKDFKFRYYSQLHFEQLLDINTGMVREIIIPNIGLKYDKPTQKEIQRVSYTQANIDRVSGFEHGMEDISDWHNARRLERIKQKTQRMRQKIPGVGMTLGQFRNQGRLQRRREREAQTGQLLPSFADMRREAAELRPAEARMQGEQEGQKFPTVAEMRRAEAHMQLQDDQGFGIRKNKKNKSKRKRRNINNK